KRADKIQKPPLNIFKGGFSFYKVRRNSPKFDKKNPQKNPRHLACPPDILYLALLFNGLTSEDYEQNGKNRMWHQFPVEGNRSNKTNADNVLRGVQRQARGEDTNGNEGTPSQMEPRKGKTHRRTERA